MDANELIRRWKNTNEKMKKKDEKRVLSGTMFCGYFSATSWTVIITQVSVTAHTLNLFTPFFSSQHFRFTNLVNPGGRWAYLFSGSLATLFITKSMRFTKECFYLEVSEAVRGNVDLGICFFKYFIQVFFLKKYYIRREKELIKFTFFSF